MGKARKLAAAGLLVMGVKVAAVCGAGAVVSSWVDDIVSSGRMVTASLNLEFGQRGRPSSSPAVPAVLAPARTDGPSAEVSPSPPGEEPAAPSQPGEQYTDEGTRIVPTTIYGGLTIKNSTGYDIDVGALVAEGAPQVLPGSGPQVLIVHTHGSEAYTPTPTTGTRRRTQTARRTRTTTSSASATS